MASRTLRLGRLAADAQVLLLRRQASLTVNRIIYGAIGAVFAVAALVLVHVILYQALRDYAHLAPILSAAIVLAVDAVVALVFALLASRHEDAVMAEARRVRDASLVELRQTMAAAAVLRPAGRYLGRKHIYGLALAALTARFLGGSRG